MFCIVSVQAQHTKKCYDYRCVINQANRAIDKGHYKIALKNLQSAFAYPESDDNEISKLFEKLFNKINGEKEKAKASAKRAKKAEKRAKDAASIAQKAEREARNAETQAKRAESKAVSSQVRAENANLKLDSFLLDVMKRKFILEAQEAIENDDYTFAIKLAEYAYSYMDSTYTDAIKIMHHAWNEYERITGKASLDLVGHKGRVRAVDVSSDKKYVVTGSGDGKAMLWDITVMDNSLPSRPVKTFEGHSGEIHSVVFSEDDKYIFTGSSDRKLIQWNRDDTTDKYIFKLPGKALRVASIDSFVAVACNNGDAFLFNYYTKDTLIISEHKRASERVALSPDKKLFASSSWDGQAHIYDIATGKKLYTLAGHTSSIHELVFAHNMKYIVTGSNDKSVRVWDIKNGNELKKLDGHDVMVNGLDVSPDSKYILSTDASGVAILWDLASEEQLFKRKIHKSIIETAIFSSDGRFFITASRDKLIKIWDIETLKLVKIFEEHDSEVAFLKNIDNSRLITVSDDRTAKVWDFSGSGKMTGSLYGTRGDKLLITKSTVNHRTKYNIWDTHTNKLIVQCDYFLTSKDKKTVVASSNSKKVFTKIISLQDSSIFVHEPIKGYLFRNSIVDDKLLVTKTIVNRKSKYHLWDMHINQLLTDSDTYKVSKDKKVVVASTIQEDTFSKIILLHETPVITRDDLTGSVLLFSDSINYVLTKLKNKNKSIDRKIVKAWSIDKSKKDLTINMPKKNLFHLRTCYQLGDEELYIIANTAKKLYTFDASSHKSHAISLKRTKIFNRRYIHTSDNSITDLVSNTAIINDVHQLIDIHTNYIIYKDENKITKIWDRTKMKNGLTSSKSFKELHGDYVSFYEKRSSFSLWNAQTGDSLFSYKRQFYKLIGNNLVITTPIYNKIEVWDLHTNQKLQSFTNVSTVKSDSPTSFAINYRNGMTAQYSYLNHQLEKQDSFRTKPREEYEVDNKDKKSTKITFKTKGEILLKGSHQKNYDKDDYLFVVTRERETNVKTSSNINYLYLWKIDKNNPTRKVCLLRSAYQEFKSLNDIIQVNANHPDSTHYFFDVNKQKVVLALKSKYTRPFYVKEDNTHLYTYQYLDRNRNQRYYKFWNLNLGKEVLSVIANNIMFSEENMFFSNANQVSKVALPLTSEGTVMQKIKKLELSYEKGQIKEHGIFNFLGNTNSPRSFSFQRYRHFLKNVNNNDLLLVISHYKPDRYRRGTNENFLRTQMAYKELISRSTDKQQKYIRDYRYLLNNQLRRIESRINYEKNDTKRSILRNRREQIKTELKLMES